MERPLFLFEQLNWQKRRFFSPLISVISETLYRAKRRKWLTERLQQRVHVERKATGDLDKPCELTVHTSSFTLEIEMKTFSIFYT